ncbi:DNA replication and repair protein RecO [Ectothiorhodospira magna]|uniref:DNA repair protein RecO n=1 Tax=Ectothiorhodospira magna TaxID=867345 RepID=A0A1H9CFC4_9GAMM|nr:DNA repair protein RecO C-terminal domain-containing protein [Ectothiorhodospira magna]SEP99453.1 DNA replication and repair protein RecO [Ectothiorhodospira magna]
MTPVSGSIAFVLHARPYRESSLLLELLTATEGRTGAILRGARSQRPPLFSPLEVTFRGRGQLPTLTGWDDLGGVSLTGNRAVCGLYINELAVRLLPRHIPQPAFLAVYAATLSALGDPDQALEPVLRRYELALLNLLGEGLEYVVVEDLEPQQLYRVDSLSGVRQADIHDTPSSPRTIQGEALVALLTDRLVAPAHQRQAKRLLRGLLEQHLDGKPIVSRQLFARGRPDMSS